MAKGQTVDLPTTFTVGKASTDDFPARQGREPSPAYTALAAIVAKAKLDTPMSIAIAGDEAQQAVGRHLRRAANELGYGLRVAFKSDTVFFQVQKKRERKAKS